MEIGKRHQTNERTQTKSVSNAHACTHIKVTHQRFYLSPFTIAANTNTYTYTHKWTNKHSAHHELVDFGPRITFQNAYHFFSPWKCCVASGLCLNHTSVSISFDTFFSKINAFSKNAMTTTKKKPLSGERKLL